VRPVPVGITMEFISLMVDSVDLPTIKFVGAPAAQSDNWHNGVDTALNPLLHYIRSTNTPTTTMISPLATFPRMSSSEEANLILQDIFQYDAEGMNAVLSDLCEQEGIAFDWEANGNEIDNLIIENEDQMVDMYDLYQQAFADETDEDQEVQF